MLLQGAGPTTPPLERPTLIRGVRRQTTLWETSDAGTGTFTRQKISFTQINVWATSWLDHESGYGVRTQRHTYIYTYIKSTCVHACLGLENPRRLLPLINRLTVTLPLPTTAVPDTRYSPLGLTSSSIHTHHQPPTTFIPSIHLIYCLTLHHIHHTH